MLLTEPTEQVRSLRHSERFNMGWLWGDDKKKKKDEYESISEGNLRSLKQKMKPKEEMAGDVGSTKNIDAIKKRKKMLEDAARD